MRRPGAYRVRAALRGARGVRRSYINARRRVAEAVLYRDTGADDVVPQPHDEHSSEFARSLSPRPVTTSPVTDMLFGRLTERGRGGDRGGAGARGGRHPERGGAHRPAPVSAVAGRAPRHPRRDRAHRADGGGAAGRRARDGARRGGRRRLGLLRRPGGGRADHRRLRAGGRDAGARLRLLIGPGGAGAAGRLPRRASGTAAIRSPRRSSGPRPTCPAIEFLQSPEEPPLPYGDQSLDVVYAISIWSHFAEPAALAWLDEMHRLLRPGGMLVLSTHGPQSITHDSNGIRGHEQLAEVRAALFKHGFWFRDEFGADRDHGVGGAEWGTAFLTTEWLAWHAAPDGRSPRSRPAAWRTTRTCTCSSADDTMPTDVGSHPGQERRPPAGAGVGGGHSRGTRRGAGGGLGLHRRLAGPGSRRRRGGAGHPAGRVRPRAHAQPGRGAHHRRPDLLPDPGRGPRSRAGWRPTARCSPAASGSAPPTARTCRGPTPAR